MFFDPHEVQVWGDPDREPTVWHRARCYGEWVCAFEGIDHVPLYHILRYYTVHPPRGIFVRPGVYWMGWDMRPYNAHDGAWDIGADPVIGRLLLSYPEEAMV
jgi:hypothetical protein